MRAALLLCLAALPALGSPLDDCEAIFRIAQEARVVQQHVLDTGQPNADERASTAEEPLSLTLLCPELALELAAHPLADTLSRPQGARSPQDARGIAALQAYYQTQVGRPGPAQNTLERAFDGLELDSGKSLTLREQFWAWVVRTFFPDELTLPDWLEDVSLGEAAAVNIVIVVVALIVLLALAVVGNELRYTSFRKRDIGSGDWGAELSLAEPTLGWADVPQLPLAQQPGAILNLVLAELENKHALDASASATHRELAAQASNMARGDGLVPLCSAAERSVYGNWQPDSNDVLELTRQAHELLQQDPGQ